MYRELVDYSSCLRPPIIWAPGGRWIRRRSGTSADARWCRWNESRPARSRPTQIAGREVEGAVRDSEPLHLACLAHTPSS